MDKVRLLTRNLKNFEYIEETGGDYVNGVWQEGTTTVIPFKAAPFPVTEKELKLFDEGALSFQDIKIYTKHDLGSVIDKGIKRVSTQETFRLYNSKPYLEIADLKMYILKRIEGES